MPARARITVAKRSTSVTPDNGRWDGAIAGDVCDAICAPAAGDGRGICLFYSEAVYG